MKSFKTLILPVIAILLIIAGFAFFKNKTEKNISVPLKETGYATLKIEGGSTYDISGYIGKTALEATESQVSVVTKGDGENAFVTSINELSADPKKREFWEFDVNGSQAQVGAGSYVIQNHDQIEWKITNY